MKIKILDKIYYVIMLVTSDVRLGEHKISFPFLLK